jgi:hypothetical protein
MLLVQGRTQGGGLGVKPLPKFRKIILNMFLYSKIGI